MEEEKKQRNDAELSEEKLALLRTYFDAFANLYGIVPLYRAVRIIRKQNPALALTDEEFLALVDRLDEEDHFYSIVGQEDIYEDGEKTPPMKREIITEWLCNYDFEEYGGMKERQEGKPFYIPDRETLLQYADELNNEETKASRTLGDFLRDDLRMKQAKDVLEELQLAASMGETDSDYILADVRRMAGKGCFPSQAKIDAFFWHYSALYDNTRMQKHRGFTPAEIRAQMGVGSPLAIGYDPEG